MNKEQVKSTSMSSNAHTIFAEHMASKNDAQLAQLIQLQILLPETLAQLHNLFFYCVMGRGRAKKGRGGGGGGAKKGGGDDEEDDEDGQDLEYDDGQTRMLDEVIRINDMYKIIHPTMRGWLEQGDARKALLALTRVITEISQSGNTVAKPKWITNEFLCLLYMYYRVPIEKWFILIRSCSPAFQQSIRTFAIYFQVENMHSQIFLLSPITLNDILAACLSSSSANIATFLDNEAEYSFQVSPPRHVLLDDDDVDMLLIGPEGEEGCTTTQKKMKKPRHDAPVPSSSSDPTTPKTKTKKKKEKETETDQQEEKGTDPPSTKTPKKQKKGQEGQEGQQEKKEEKADGQKGTKTVEWEDIKNPAAQKKKNEKKKKKRRKEEEAESDSEAEQML